MFEVSSTERWFPREELGGGYRIPLPPGSYSLTLHFSEIHRSGVGHYHTSIDKISKQVEGPRCFDVLIENKTFLDRYRPLDAGFVTADEQIFTIDVTDGMLEIVFAPRIRYPVISAIEVERLQ